MNIMFINLEFITENGGGNLNNLEFRIENEGRNSKSFFECMKKKEASTEASS